MSVVRFRPWPPSQVFGFTSLFSWCVNASEEKQYTFLSAKSEIQAHLGRVSDLVEGLESPFGLELLSTAHWVATQERTETMDQIVTRTFAWNDGQGNVIKSRGVFDFRLDAPT